MAQNNVSERKRKLRKQNKNLPNPNENVPKKVSRDALKKERAKEREEAAAAAAPEPKKRKLAINAMLLKSLLLMAVGVNLLGIVLFEPDTQMHQVLRGIGMMGVPIAVFLTVEGYYNTGSRSRYCLRILIWGILAEIPMFFLGYYENVRNAYMRLDYFQGLGENGQAEYLLKWREFPMINYLGTVLFALLIIWVLDKAFSRFHSPETTMMWKGFYGALMVFILTVGIVIAVFLQTLKVIESPILTVMFVFCYIIFRGKGELLSMVSGIIGITFGMFFGPENGRLFYAAGTAIPSVLFRLYRGRLGYDKVKRPQIKHAFYMIYVAMLASILFIGMAVFVKNHPKTDEEGETVTTEQPKDTAGVTASAE